MVDFLSPLADAKVFKTANSSSVGPFGSACFCFRVVRLFVGPNNRCLRRGLWVREAMVGSVRTDFDPLLRPLIDTNSDSRLSHVPASYTQLSLLNSHLTEWFSVFYSASPSRHFLSALEASD